MQRCLQPQLLLFQRHWAIFSLQLRRLLWLFLSRCFLALVFVWGVVSLVVWLFSIFTLCVVRVWLFAVVWFVRCSHPRRHVPRSLVASWGMLCSRWFLGRIVASISILEGLHLGIIDRLSLIMENRSLFLCTRIYLRLWSLEIGWRALSFLVGCLFLSV